MNQYKKLSLFEDDWWKKMDARQLLKARGRLDAYSTSTTLDTGLREVRKNPFFN